MPIIGKPGQELGGFGTITIAGEIAKARAAAGEELMRDIGECDCGEHYHTRGGLNTRCPECETTYITTAAHLGYMRRMFN